MKRRRARYSPAEYFLAAVGALILLMVAAMVACPGGCSLAPSPEIGLRPPQPTPAR